MALTSSLKRPEKLEISPYVGPRPYERKDRDLFYGRDYETMQIISLILSNPLTLIYSQSGVGKTSLFNTKIIYELEKQYKFQTFPSARVRSLVHSDKIPKDVNNLYMFNALLCLDPDVNLEALKNRTLSNFLKEHSPKSGREEKSVPRIIVFDQLEELFGLYPENWYDQQQGFFQQIAEAINEDSMLRIVLVVREEYLAHLSSFANLVPGRIRARFRLERLGKEAALLAVIEPLKPTGRCFASGVAEKLVDDLLTIRVENIFGEIVDMRGEYVEPVHLQVVCQRLWMKVVSSGINEITEEHLKGSVDVNKALREFYLDVISDAAKQTGIKQNAIRNWFDQKLITSSGTRGIVHRETNSTGGIPNTVVEVLQQRYIIRPEWRSGSRWYELTHDRLIEPILESNKEWNQKRKIKRAIISTVLIASFVIGIVVVAYPLLTPQSQTLIIRIVTVGAAPMGVDVNPNNNMVYVANSKSNTISIINGTTNNKIIDVLVGPYSQITGLRDIAVNPIDVAVNPNNNMVYVANSKSNTISIINGTTYSKITDLAVGDSPMGVAVNPVTNTIYVANSKSNTISIINDNGTTYSKITDLAVGDSPMGVAVNPDNNMVYVTNSKSNTISIVDGAKNTIVRDLPVGATPVGVAVNPNTNRIYVANGDSNSVSAIDGKTNTVIQNIDVGNGLASVAVNPVINTIYAVNSGDDNLSVINLNSKGTSYS